MKVFLSTFLALVAFLVASNSMAAPKRIIWKGDPVGVVLNRGIEQRITFPDAQALWLDLPNKIAKKVTTQVVGNDIYWTAKEPFKKIRVTVGEDGTGRVYLLDLSAGNGKQQSVRLLIVEGEDPYAKVNKKVVKKEPTVVDKIRGKSKAPSAGYATMFRFAASEVYAPTRLRLKDTGIQRARLQKQKVKYLLRNPQVETTIAVGWRAGNGMYITALEVINKSSSYVALDPREIRGMWKASLFHHSALKSYGSRGDNTTLYLISDKPFKEALRSHPMIKGGQ